MIGKAKIIVLYMQPSVQTLFKPPFQFDRPVDDMLFDCGIFHFPQYSGYRLKNNVIFNFCRTRLNSGLAGWKVL